jgi:uncharacterized RmlC-like cupin family protein
MAMAEIPETRYVKSGDIHIAYQVLGTGPLDLVYVPGFVSHLEHQWQNGSGSVRRDDLEQSGRDLRASLFHAAESRYPRLSSLR